MVGSKEWKWSPSVLSIMFNQMFYHLVNIQKTMESHHFSWENPLFLWPFSIAKCYKLPGIMAYQVVSLVILHSLSISSPAIPGRWGTSSICHPVYLQPMWCSEPSIWILCIYIYIYNYTYTYIYICTILEFDIYKYVYIYITLVAHDIKWYHTNPCFKGIDDWAMLKLSGSAELRGFGAGESSVFPWKILI